jgi:ABC-type multidrug transport system ATPase subunit
MSSAAIAVEGISFAYDGRRAVDEVAFTVERGETLGFLGPNGAG